MSNIYNNCKLYGPYKSKKDGRLRCVLHFDDKSRKTISYPKYLVEIYLNRYLSEDETIDHIDGDINNNDLSNLRVVKRTTHCFEDAVVVNDVVTNCKWCNKLFTIKGHRLNQRNRSTASGFCSKSCTGKYGTHIQHHNGQKLDKMELDKVYTKRKSALKVTSIVEEQNIGEILTGNADDNAEA